jgi:hypothetical protein
MPMPPGKDFSDQDRPAAALSAVEKERRKENFQEFLSRQHAAQERKKIQMQEVRLLRFYFILFFIIAHYYYYSL